MLQRSFTAVGFTWPAGRREDGFVLASLLVPQGRAGQGERASEHPVAEYTAVCFVRVPQESSGLLGQDGIEGIIQ